MTYLRRTREFVSEHGRTIERLYLGAVVVPVGIYWDGQFVAETIRAGQDLLYSQTTQEAMNCGSEVFAGGLMTGLTGLCVILSALVAKRGPVNREENQPQEQPQT